MEKRASAYVWIACTLVLWTAVKRARMRGDDDIHWANRSEHLLSRRLVARLSRTSIMLSSMKTEGGYHITKSVDKEAFIQVVHNAWFTYESLIYEKSIMNNTTFLTRTEGIYAVVSPTWFNPRTPMLYYDIAGERDLQVAKIYAPVTSTRQDANISESLKHELYENIFSKKKKTPNAKIWAPADRNLVLQACMVAAHAIWHTVFQRLLQRLMTCHEACGRTLYMHPATNLVKCIFLVQEPKPIWFVCVGLVAETVVYVNGTHLRW